MKLKCENGYFIMEKCWSEFRPYKLWKKRWGLFTWSLDIQYRKYPQNIFDERKIVTVVVEYQFCAHFFFLGQISKLWPYEHSFYSVICVMLRVPIFSCTIKMCNQHGNDVFTIFYSIFNKLRQIYEASMGHSLNLLRPQKLWK